METLANLASRDSNLNIEFHSVTKNTLIIVSESINMYIAISSVRDYYFQSEHNH
jgi:hypothetical protein